MGLLPEGREFLHSVDRALPCLVVVQSCEMGFKPVVQKYFTSTLILELCKTCFYLFTGKKTLNVTFPFSVSETDELNPFLADYFHMLYGIKAPLESLAFRKAVL